MVIVCGIAIRFMSVIFITEVMLETIRMSVLMVVMVEIALVRSRLT